MKIAIRASSKSALKLAAVSIAALFTLAPAATLAAPVTYHFQSTITTPFTLFGSDPAVTAAAITALGPNPVISGSFVYDAASPVTFAGTPTSATSYTSQTTPGFSNFSATVGGFSFSDSVGLVTVGNNKTFGNPNTDFIQLALDSSLVATSVPRTFTPFALGISQVVNVRLFWFKGSPSIPADFLSDESLPASLPASPMLARVSLDFGDPLPGSTLVTRSGVLLDGVVVTAVPEPETYAMLMAGLIVTGLAARRKSRRGKERAA